MCRAVPDFFGLRVTLLTARPPNSGTATDFKMLSETLSGGQSITD